MTQLLRDAYRYAVLSRKFEDRIIHMGMAGEIPPTLHPGAGHEVCQTAALAALGPDDKVLYSHRGVAYMIARGTPLTAILADIANKEGGTNRGKGGVMHVVDVPHGVLGESGTLGGGLVVCAGVAMALKRFGKGQVVAHFFGDGGSNRGTFHESLNFSAVQRLPAIFFCENNGWAVSVPTSESTSVPDIASRAHGYGIPGVVVDGNDAFAVFDAMTTAVARARNGDGPTLIEAKVVRLAGHYIGDPQLYRPDRDLAAQKDPLPGFAEALIEAGILERADLETIDAEAQAEVERAVAVVAAAPLLDPALALQDLYA
ncbi:MAG: thiamine pyrophosphate-dependent dehydrogenase E1 component subunit alpha [Chloroflexi bacterium]|nr:thiamine pyrophosphate-dependent dehydrogenase E1 component subunit alpha [Chloroflexota bacterium]